MLRTLGKKINTVMERFTFYSRAHKDDESIEEYVAALHTLAGFCQFETITYEQVLRVLTNKY